VSFDSIVRGGDVALPESEQRQRLDIAIRDGRVAALLEPGTDADGAEEWDVTGQLVLPGAVDPHVHVAWPYLGSRTADDYETATRAAAAGGTTTIVDFAIEGRESPMAALEQRREQAEGAAVVDFSFHSVVSEASREVLSELEAVVDAGVTSFKLYMTYRRRGLAVDDRTLAKVCRRAAELGARVGVHAENGDLDDLRTETLRAEGRGAPIYLPDAKPPVVEAEAVYRAGRIAAAAGAQLWILHLSSADGLGAALAARRAAGQPAALETCPQYLLLTREALARPDGHRFLCSPPLRGRTDNAALWDAVRDGTVDWIGTDHCLFLARQKDERADAFWDCPHGLPGVQTRPMLFLHAARERGITANACARKLAANAARWFGMYPQKGTLQPGSDADLAAWAPDARVRIRSAELAMGGDWTPFEDVEAFAPPSLVLVRGVPVVAPGGAAAPSGNGRFLARPLRAEAVGVA
jgi:dihydropyrimidinase